MVTEVEHGERDALLHITVLHFGFRCYDMDIAGKWPKLPYHRLGMSRGAAYTPVDHAQVL